MGCGQGNACAVTLLAPANGANLTDQTITFDWADAGCWGYACARGSYTINYSERHYELLLRPQGESVWTTVVRLTGTDSPPANPPSIYTYTVPATADYEWQVKSFWEIPLSGQPAAQGSSFSSIWTFGVTAPAGPWWQSGDGDVHAQGVITTDIPPQCTTPGCLPYASKEGSGGYPGVGSAGTSASFGDGSVSTQGWLATTSLSLTSSKYGYQPFYLRAGSPTSPAFSGALPGSSGVYFAGSNQTISSAWTLPAGRSLVIFVDGNLSVNASIDVPVGSFLALIVSGNITFGPTVSAAEGIFVADGAITTASSSTGFAGEGVFVGWGGFSLNRDLGIPANDTAPAEDFVWRPDLIIELLDTVLVREPLLWQEVAP